MKNITVAVRDDVYRAARIAAAERGTSVSAMVAQFLESVAIEPEPDPRGQARRDFAAIVEDIRRNNPEFKASERLPRDELYTRGSR